jgi:hypothetical protein
VLVLCGVVIASILCVVVWMCVVFVGVDGGKMRLGGVEVFCRG